MQVIRGLVDLIYTFAQILHSIRARSVVACSVFGEKGERGFDVIDLTFFGLFPLFFGRIL